MFSKSLVASGSLTSKTQTGFLRYLYARTAGYPTPMFWPWSLSLSNLSVQSVLEELRPESEEAAKTTGASSRQTFWYVTFPEIRQGISAGTMLAFARVLGAFGSVAVVSGMSIGSNQTAPLKVMTSFGLMFTFELIRRRRKCQ